jgi:hypothetical protein
MAKVTEHASFVQRPVDGHTSGYRSVKAGGVDNLETPIAEAVLDMKNSAFRSAARNFFLFCFLVEVGHILRPSSVGV